VRPLTRARPAQSRHTATFHLLLRRLRPHAVGCRGSTLLHLPPPPPPVSSAPPSAAAQPSFDAPRRAPPLSFSTCSPSVRSRSKQSPPTSTRCLCPPPPYTARCHRLHSRALIGASPPPSVPHLHAAACAEPALNVVAHARPGIVGFCRGPCLALFRTPLPPSAGPPATGPRATAAQAAAPPVIGAELSCCF
jgi:hypothetical protein